VLLGDLAAALRALAEKDEVLGRMSKSIVRG